jgi:S1-C subfamily serine protease
MANTIGLKINTKAFEEDVRPMFGSARADALLALESSRATGTGDAYKRAVEVVRTARQAAADALHSTGGSAAPVQQADWYWEEYNRSDTKGTEFLVFVRFDLSGNSLKALIQEYSSVIEVLGSKVVTLFPGLVWRQVDAKQGVVVLDAGGRLKSLGVQDDDIILALNGEPVRSSADLASKLEKFGSGATLKVKGKDGNLRELRR